MRSHALFLFLIVASTLAPAAEVEFEGTPTVKIEVLDGATQTQSVPRQHARESGVIITRGQNGYLWASRKNVPLVRHESGVYITYVATTGAGYIRVLSPAMRTALNSLPASERENEFVYMEHLVNQLGSITYFGK